jgi:hypothetical protein
MLALELADKIFLQHPRGGFFQLLTQRRICVWGAKMPLDELRHLRHQAAHRATDDPKLVVEPSPVYAASVTRALQQWIRQQEILAELGVVALQGKPFLELLNETVRLTAEGMNAEFCKVLEYIPAENRFLMRSGVGWHEGIVGRATFAQARAISRSILRCSSVLAGTDGRGGLRCQARSRGKAELSGRNDRVQEQIAGFRRQKPCFAAQSQPLRDFDLAKVKDCESKTVARTEYSGGVPTLRMLTVRSADRRSAVQIAANIAKLPDSCGKSGGRPAT